VTDPTSSIFGCILGTECIPFNTPRDVDNQCIVSSRINAAPGEECSGTWIEQRGIGKCDCQGKHIEIDVPIASSSLGADLARARRSQSLASTSSRDTIPTLRDGLGNVWSLESNIWQQTIQPLVPLSDIAGIHLADGGSWCDSERIICIADHDVVTSVNGTLPQQLCSAELAPGEAMLVFNLSSNLQSTSLPLSTFSTNWLPRSDVVCRSPFILNGTLRLLTPKDGWSSSSDSQTWALRLTYMYDDGQEHDVQVTPSMNGYDADQMVRFSQTIFADHTTPVRFHIGIEGDIQQAGLQIIHAGLSLTLQAIGCGQPFTNGNVTMSPIQEGYDVGSVVHFTCPTNFKLSGASNMTCLSSNLWSSPEPQCLPVRCPSLGAINYGHYVLSASSSVAEVGAVATLECGNYTSSTLPNVTFTCLSSGKWQFASNGIQLNRTYVSCEPDGSKGACVGNATRCTNYLNPGQCVESRCHWCGLDQPNLTNTSTLCQPAEPCYDIKRQIWMDSCSNQYVEEPPQPPLQEEDVNTTRFCNFTIIQQANCANLSLMACITSPSCRLCPSARMSAIIAFSNSTSSTTSYAKPECTWIPQQQQEEQQYQHCQTIDTYNTTNAWNMTQNNTLITVYGFHSNGCPAYWLEGDFPPYGEFNLTSPGEEANITLGPNDCTDDMLLCGQLFGEDECRNVTSCDWCNITSVCAPTTQCFDRSVGSWRSTCPLYDRISTIDQFEEAYPPIQSCSLIMNATWKAECESAAPVNCSMHRSCVPCEEPNAVNLTYSCIYSPSSTLCILSNNGSWSYELVGSGSCPFTITNYTAVDDAAKIKSEPPPMRASKECDVCQKSTQLPAGVQMPSINITDKPKKPIKGTVPSIPCSRMNQALCPSYRTEADCSDRDFCLWCAGSSIGRSSRNTGDRCIFAPVGECELGGRRFPRHCIHKCSLREATCMRNMDRESCEKSSAAAVLRLPGEESCAWCEKAKKCYAAKRCLFGSRWSYQCDDLQETPATPSEEDLKDVPLCSKEAVTNMTRCTSVKGDTFCNHVLGCQLCIASDPFLLDLPPSVQCSWHPDIGSSSCRFEGNLYQPGICPVYTGQASDCVTDDTMGTKPPCLIPQVNECAALNYTACASQSNCTWCLEWDGTSRQSCMFTPLLNTTARPFGTQNDAQCLFTSSLGTTFLTGLGEGTCPIPQGNALLTELREATGATQPCNIDQMRCTVTHNASLCQSFTACRWCEEEELCIPLSTCMLPSLTETPYYCPRKRCPVTAPQQCANLTVATCELADHQCKVCGADTSCRYNPSELCSISTRTSVTVYGEDRCPAVFTRPSHRIYNCTATESFCLMQATSTTCESSFPCHWCPTLGACQPRSACRFEGNGLIYGGPCGYPLSDCPFQPPMLCAKHRTEQECMESNINGDESGPPCEWCPASQAGGESACMYAPTALCQQTVGGDIVNWQKGRCKANMDYFASLPKPCRANITGTVWTHVWAQTHINGRSFCNVSWTHDALITGATHSTSCSAELPCAKAGTVISVTFGTRKDLPLASIAAQFNLGRRIIATNQYHAWTCQALPFNYTQKQLEIIRSTDFNDILWQPAMPPSEPYVGSRRQWIVPPTHHEIYPPDCCLYHFTPNRLPHFTLPREEDQTNSGEDYPADSRSRIVDADGKRIRKGCISQAMEYWDATEKVWKDTYTDENGIMFPFPGIFYVNNMDSVMARTFQPHHQQLYHLLNGKLLRLNVTCGSDPPSCLQFSVGSAEQDLDLLRRPVAPGNCSAVSTTFPPSEEEEQEESDQTIEQEQPQKTSNNGFDKKTDMVGRIPPNCCLYRFTSPVLPAYRLPREGGDASVFAQSRIVMADGSPLNDLCSVTNDGLEYWDPYTRTWNSTYIDPYGQRQLLPSLFYLKNGNALMVQMFQSNHQYLYDLLEGHLVRLHLTCADRPSSCLQFSLGDSYWSPASSLGSVALPTLDWISAPWICPDYKALMPTVPLTNPMEAICRFTVPGDVTLQLAVDRVKYAMVVINGESVMTLHTNGTGTSVNASTSVFTHTAQLNSSHAAYQIDILAIRLPTNQSASVNASIIPPAFLADVTVYASHILSGWRCRSLNMTFTMNDDGDDDDDITRSMMASDGNIAWSSPFIFGTNYQLAYTNHTRSYQPSFSSEAKWMWMQSALHVASSSNSSSWMDESKNMTELDINGPSYASIIHCRLEVTFEQALIAHQIVSRIKPETITTV